MDSVTDGPGPDAFVMRYGPEDDAGDLLDRVDGMWLDKSARPISMRRWGELKYGDDGSYMRIGSDELVTKGGLRVWVSTVWLGLDHSLGYGGGPVIFETMVFDADQADGRLDEVTDYGGRYRTELEARQGHQEIAGQIAQDWWLDLGGRALG